MKEFWKKIQPLLYMLLWFLVGTTFVVFLVAADQAHHASPCKGLNVNISHNQDNFFVDEIDVENMLYDFAGKKIEGTAVGEFDLEDLERKMEQHPYIESAEIYIDLNRYMWVNIHQRNPLARVINEQNQSYYLSYEGEKMPVSRSFSSRVPVITGYVKDNGRLDSLVAHEMTQALHQLMLRFQKDAFYNALIEQIYVRKNGDLILIPKIGHLEIEFGPIERVEEKLNILKTLYQQGINTLKWKKYKAISLKYKGQIVCTKRE